MISAIKSSFQVLCQLGVPSRMVRVVPLSSLWVMMSATRTMAV